MISLEARHHLRHGLLGNAECYAYQTSEGGIAVAIVHGRLIPEEAILVRIQSACFYGEVMLATDCDCRAQLNQSMRDIREAGCGVIIHLDQEGRGAGMIAKAKGYELHDRENLDTVQSYERMQIEVDSRKYDTAAEILQALRISHVRLITNNPRKIDALRAAGLDVIRFRQDVAANDANLDYLRVKKTKLGHLLDLPKKPDAGDSTGSFRCTVVGAAVMDHVFSIPHNPQLGRSRQATGYKRQPGGRGLNQAIALSRLGASSGLLASRGADSDALEISEALVAESVETWLIDAAEIRSPQTIALEPKDSQHTYINWLTREHRTLVPQQISRWSAQLAMSDAVLFTAEPSTQTVDSVLRLLSDRQLAILTAAPAIEGWRIPTSLLERIDVVIGSESELRALHGDPQNNVPIDEVIKSFTESCGLTAVVTDLKAPRRVVRGYNQQLERHVAVESPTVRVAERRAPAIGNRDVFSAAFAYGTLKRQHIQDDGAERRWRGPGSFFGHAHNLLDVMLEAVVAEAWVVKSGTGGYLIFPTEDDLARWQRRPPRVIED